MKFYTILLPIFLLAACNSKPTENTETDIDNSKLERYFETLFHKKVTATIYIVHPEVCGACSNDFLVKMSKKKSSLSFYLLATGEFKAEHADAANKIRSKIRFIQSKAIYRKGLSPDLPQVVELVNGKIISVDVLDL